MPPAARELSAPPHALRRLACGPWPAVVLAVLCFVPSFWNGFTYDDVAIARDNPRVRNLGDMRAIWLSDWWQPQTIDAQIEHRYRDRLYRPLTLFTVALNYAVNGPAPRGYHVFNVALHALACFLVWRLARRLFQDEAVAALAAVVFAVHPVHAEAVANVVGRAEVLATIFLLAGLLVLLPAGRVPRWTNAAGAAALFFAALLSKETAVCYLPVALVVLHGAAQRPPGRPVPWWLQQAGILALPLLVYLPLRYVALDHHLLRDSPPVVLLNPLVWGDLPQRLLHSFTVLGHYARLLVAPAKLSCNYGLAIIDVQRGPELLTQVGLVTALAVIVALAGYWRRERVWRQFAMLAAVAVFSYALISNVVLIIGVSVAERLMYWPSVPFVLAVAVGLVAAWRRLAGDFSREMKMLLPICGLALLVALGARSGFRSIEWADNSRLFITDVQTYPASAELSMLAAQEFLRQYESADRAAQDRIIETADQLLQQALAIHPSFPEALELRARILGTRGQYDDAIEHLELSRGLLPLNKGAQELLARLQDESGAQAAQLAALAEQVAAQPESAVLRRDYGEQLLIRGQRDEALRQLQEAARLDPEDGQTQRLLGDAYVANNQYDQAVPALLRAVQKLPDDWRVHVNLAALLARSDPPASLHHAERAVALLPEAIQARTALAEALVVNKRLPEALAQFRALERDLAPGHPLRPGLRERIRSLERGAP